ncbi:hypothetical protein ACHAW6_002725 [Cyclotella cf. meneghiniana]
MSQRLLASHSALFTKGVALKAGDWRNPDVTDMMTQDSKMMKRSESVTSMSSLQNQFKIQRPSSSSVATNSMIRSRSYSALPNAIFDDTENRSSFPKQPDSSRSSLINLVSVKTDDISKIDHTIINEKSSLHTSAFQFPKGASLHTIRSRPSMPNLSSLVEEKEEEGLFKPISQCLSSLFDVVAHDTDYAFKIIPPDTRNKLESSFRTAKDASNYSIRSRVSVPNLSSLVEEEEEEEEVLFKQYPVSSTQNNKKDVIVETFNAKVPRQIDLRDVSSSDLALLKEDDPFMYYSIPAVRNTAWKGDHTDMPSPEDSDLSPRDSPIHERKSRISVESWNLPSPSNIAVDKIDGYFIPSLGGAFFDLNMDDNEDDEDPIDDFLLTFASEMVRSSDR